MSRSLGKSLPKEAFEFLKHDNPDRENVAILLAVRDDDDYPHMALFSPFQVVASTPDRFYVAIHVGSRTEGFMEKWKNVTLVLQVLPSVYYIKCRVTKVEDWEDPVDELYQAEISDVLVDYSDTAPFVSLLAFDVKMVLPSYSEEFGYIRKYASEHQ